MNRKGPPMKASSSVKVITTGASPCPQSVKEQVIAHFGPCLFESYGSTEVDVTVTVTCSSQG